MENATLENAAAALVAALQAGNKPEIDAAEVRKIAAAGKMALVPGGPAVLARRVPLLGKLHKEEK